MADEGATLLKRHIRHILNGSLVEVGYRQDQFNSSVPGRSDVLDRAGQFRIKTATGYIQGEIVVRQTL